MQAQSETYARRLRAAAWRRKFRLPVIAVGGAAGKTTTKAFIVSLLAGRWPQVLATRDNGNGWLGLPATLLQLSTDHQAAVIEIGINCISDMDEKLDVVAPTIGILTSAGAEHLELLGSADTAADEEFRLLARVVGSGGVVAINQDDPAIAARAASLPAGPHLRFSLRSGVAGPQVLRGRWNPSAQAVSIDGAGLDGLWLPVPLPGEHNARNLLGAVAVARLLDLDAGEISRGIESFVPPEARSETYTLPNGSVVIADHYNANPVSMAAALHLLDLAPGRRWACLGDMLELGACEERYHRALVGPILEAGLQHAVLVGERMNWLADELAQRDRAVAVRWFPSTALAEVAGYLRQHLNPGDWILVKGSRAMQLERVLEDLLEWK